MKNFSAQPDPRPRDEGGRDPAGSDRHRLRPIVDPQFGHDVLEMHLHGFLCSEELFRDIAIPVA